MLAGTGARPRVAEGVFLPGRVHRVPGIGGRVSDPRDVVVVSAEVVRRRDVVGSLGGPGRRLRVVHAGVPTGELFCQVRRK